ncbi:MAG: tetratricopeptide repeat protein [Alphaproteobacteria bacterium]|nr:tetratricopeptide repeat protein [Alphaproteobacteria bacterium]
MADILDEIQDDLRFERFLKIWRHGSRFYLLLALLAIVVTSVYSGYNYYLDNKHQQEGDRLYKALQQANDPANNPPNIAKIFHTLAAQPTNTKVLAQFKEAELLASHGKGKEAIAVYKSVSDHSSNSVALRDLADLSAVYVGLDQHLLSEDDAQKTLTKLARQDGPFRFSANEALLNIAILHHDEKHQRALISTLLNDPFTPSTIRQRMEELANALFPGQIASLNAAPQPQKKISGSTKPRSLHE